MRFSKFVLAFFALLSLSACAGTMEGIGKDIKDVGNWSKGHHSSMEKSFGRVPTGYAGQNPPRVLKPQSYLAEQVVVQETAWNEVGEYNPATAPAPEAVPFNESVSVYPVDGQGELAPIGSSYPVTQATNMDYGRLLQQIYFLHASDNLTASERGQLRNTAGEINRSNPVAVTVIGHASTRVDGVTDPVQKKVINFEMAQKRADAVTRVLNDAGVRPALVQSLSRGDDEPNPAPGGRSQEAADRRVEVFVK